MQAAVITYRTNAATLLQYLRSAIFFAEIMLWTDGTEGCKEEGGGVGKKGTKRRRGGTEREGRVVEMERMIWGECLLIGKRRSC